MRYAPEHKQRTRSRIVDAAGRAFRLKGFSGVGVDGLMEAAELTSGGFYGHFSSKRALFREVVTAGLCRLRARIQEFQSKEPTGWLEALATYYLGQTHRRNVAGGCALPSLSAEVARADPETRGAYEAELLQAARAIAADPAFGRAEDRMQRAWAVLALLAGGVTLARAVSDEAVAEEISAAARAAVLAVADADETPGPVGSG
jgi:TetR/AcrR family transcriptional regulator, transcriptional repressor for nem operon